jgi:2-polyprenyl-6-methoxyphenol hydroxylase-like FAD-dependent oxidoreductase
MRAEATGLIEQSGRVVGVRAKTPEGELEIRAALTVGADGRSSVVRKSAGLEVVDLGAPMDVLWLRMSRGPNDPAQTLGLAAPGKIFIMIDREEYWQCGLVIAKGGFDAIRAKGIEQFREDLAALAPFLRDRTAELRDWKDVSLLTVKVDHLREWSRPGLLCIGDAAHAMSPIGGVGINLATQDAVATANIVGAKIRAGTLADSDLAAVQRRRTFPTRATQRLQVFIQKRIIERVLKTAQPLIVPWPLKMMQRWPALRRIPARVVGIGFRPEHIRTPDIQAR